MINSVQNHNSIYFRGYNGRTPIGNTQLNHYTMMFRDLPILNFVKDYARQKFPNGTHIADLACSQGQEAHSLAMLLSDVNRDKKYKITGYDISRKVVEMAKRGLFVIEDAGYESVLFDNPSAKPFRPGFHLFEDGKFFLFNQKYQEQKRHQEAYKKLEISPREVQTANKLFDAHFSALNISLKRQRDFIKKAFPDANMPRSNNRVVRADKSKFEGVLDFQLRDVKNARDFLREKSSGIVMGHNFLYLVTGARDGTYDLAKVQPAREIFNAVHDVLPPNGIFSIGRLSFDHLQNELTYGLETVVQKGQKIKVFQNSQVHKEMRNAGFEPIFYAKGSHYDSYVPAVWRKQF